MIASPFCNGPFWDPNLTWNTTNPNLTQCMRDTVLVGIPCAILWISGPLWLIKCYFSKATDVSPKLSFLFTAKLLTTLLLVINSLGELTYRLEDTGWHAMHSSDLFQPLCLLSTYFLSMTMVILEKRWISHTSPPQFTLWFTLFLGSVPTFKVQIEDIMDNPKNTTLILLSATYVPVVFFILALNCWADLDVQQKENDPPENFASFFSHLFYSWMDRLIWQGFKSPLVKDQIPNGPISVNVTRNVYSFLKRWNSKITSLEINFTKPLDTAGNPRKKISVYLTLIQTFGTRFFLASVVGVSHYVLIFVNPKMLKNLVNFINSDEEYWKGFLYALTMFFASMMWTLTFHQYCQHLTIISLQMRSTLVSLIYRKSLKLSNQARKKFTVGEMTNYVSVDAQRIVDSFWQVNHLWASPFQIIIALYLIYLELGVATFAGIGVMLLLIPINICTTKISEILEKKYLEHKDKRLKLLNEILTGMKVLKLYAWENPFMKRVKGMRDQEIHVLRKTAKVWATTNLSFSASPFLTSIAVFSAYTSLDPNNILTADKIFITIALFNVMRLPLAFFPWSLMEFVKLVVSLNRINRFLNADELDPEMISNEVEQDENAIEIKDGSFSWNEDAERENTLEDININIKKGSLVAVVGTVGSGKSSLISAILGDMNKMNGSVNVSGQIAYVPQQAWIQNMTLKNNILFDKEDQERKYNRVMEACALKSDMDILASGDSTEIGENGINLSGGQKQRVSLARAVYSEADVYLLDDPLSAVDAHVGKHIFENVISSENGILRGETRLLVTHSVNFLEKMDEILVMREGKIAERGTYAELIASKGAFSEFLIQYKSETESPEDPNKTKGRRRGSQRSVSEQSSSRPIILERRISETHYGSPGFGSPRARPFLPLEEDRARSQSNISTQSDRVTIVSESQEEGESTCLLPTTPMENNNGQLIEEEAALTGQVHWSVYLGYLKTLGIGTTLVCITMYILGIGIHTVSNYWLACWADANEKNMTIASGNTGYYLGVYGVMGSIEVMTEFTRELLLFLSTATAAKITHEKLMSGVMKSPMSFFDTNPTGRIVNRFSADIDAVDQRIPFQLTDFFYCMCEVVAVMVVICYSVPFFMTIIPPLFIFYFFVQRYYITTSRQLKRLESISKSPIFAHFTESITGATSIRAFKQEERFIAESEGKVASNVKCYYMSLSSNRWLACRIETLGNIVIFFTAFFIILAEDKISPGIAGLALTYAIQVVDTLNWMIRMVCDLETNSVALERIKEYSENTPEADWEIPSADSALPENWPDTGKITFENYQTRYREGLDLVLKGINMTIKAEEKIGICGRTGAGKSSLTLALFRIIEPAYGKIVIDNVDISVLGLHQLRSRLTIIPQDPVLFTGDLRFNLDPTEVHSDDEIWQSLEQAHLKEHVIALSDGLSHEVSEGGQNFSVGQRQLICLARALLRKTKVLILDEATAAVDLETDDLIQATIRREFSDCTVLTIAHRLNTIMDSSRIAVLSEGKLAEMDTPSVLMNDANSALKSMAKSTGTGV